jgi:hypothetical protein
MQFFMLMISKKCFWTKIQELIKTKPTLHVTFGIHLCESSLIFVGNLLGPSKKPCEGFF